MSDRTYSPDVESTPATVRALRDDPNLEWPDVRCQACGAAILTKPGAVTLCPRCQHDDRTNGSALFPEIPTWTDEQLVIAIELADLRKPALGLYAVGDQPDRHQEFLHECWAELVRRLEERGVRFAA